jgi:hypothetical protein
MKKLISLVTIIACVTMVQAQYVANALRFSQNFPTFTARSMAMGGAFTSLGGDFSSAYINPAGLGLYRKSEFHFTPGLSYTNTNAKYIGQSQTDYKYQLMMSSLGYVGTYNSNKEKGLVSASYAIGYNRLNNFDNNIMIKGNNDNSSYSDYFVEYASSNHITPDKLDPFYERLAYDAWVIDTMNYTDQYKSLVPVPIEQRRFVQTKGGIGEWSFAFGLNFNNAFYVGMGLGINQLKYKQSSSHSEINHNNSYAFRSFDFKEDLSVKGTGINFKIGLLARVTKSIRIGTTIFLPTFYNLEETYYNTMYSEYDDSSFLIKPTDVNGNELEAGKFKYNLNTPFKVKSGISVQIGKVGIISGDVEYINYTSIKMRTDNDYGTSNDHAVVDGVNSAIDSAYRSVFNLKLGGEVRLGGFAIRVGGGYYPSPYASGELNKNASYTEITSGIGYRNNNIFFDFGFSGIFHKEYYNLYTSNNFDNIATLQQQKYRFIATIGFKF